MGDIQRPEGGQDVDSGHGRRAAACSAVCRRYVPRTCRCAQAVGRGADGHQHPTVSVWEGRGAAMSAQRTPASAASLAILAAGFFIARARDRTRCSAAPQLKKPDFASRRSASAVRIFGARAASLALGCVADKPAVESVSAAGGRRSGKGIQNERMCTRIKHSYNFRNTDKKNSEVAKSQ
jgi:hypothetical protein